MSKRIIVTLIAMVMAVLFAGAAVYADSGDPGISLGAGVLQKGAGMEKEEGTYKLVPVMQKLYYGTDSNGAGIAWYVIAYDGCYGDGGGISFVDFQINYLYPDDSVTLLQCGASESAEFNREPNHVYTNAYGWLESNSGDSQIPSYLRSYLESRYLSGWNDNGKARKPYISSKEQSAILPRDLDGHSDDYSTENYRSNRIKGEIVKDALLWPLSVAEAEKLPETARVTGEDVDWWLRSPGEFGLGSDGLIYHKAAYVSGYGVISYKGERTDYDYKVRPAFNLNRKTVALTSAASGGKTSGETGKDALTAVGTNSSEEWKVTLLDDDHKDFDVVKNETTYDSKTGTMTVTYTGAMTGENEYISAVIVRDGAVRYYGRIKALKSDSDKSGTAEISLKGKMDRKSGDKLYVFNEQYNGDKTGSSAAMTDFTSALKEVRAYIEPYAIVMGADVLGNSYNTSDAQIVYYGKDEQGTAYPWRVIGCENYNGSVASSVGNMTLFADQDMAFTMFNPTNNRTNVYEGSHLRKSVDTISETISDEEKNAIVKRTLKHGKYSAKDDTDCIAGDYDLDDQILWPLSTKEAFSTDLALRVDAAEESWWLRSPGNDERYAAFVSKFGDVFPVGNGVDVERAVRPAFSLNIDSVLFASAAENGKKSGGGNADGTGAAALTGVGKNKAGEWKVTLLDDGSENAAGNRHKGFDVSVDKVTYNKGTNEVTIPYQGAVSGNNEYISAIIKRGDEIKHYGRIAKVSKAEDSVTVKINYCMGKDDKLYVFNEQHNSDGQKNGKGKFTSYPMTDFASGLKEVPFEIPRGHDWKDATCTEPKTCSKCGATEGEPLGHDWGDWQVTKEPTPDKYGAHTRVCRNDPSHIETEKIAASSKILTKMTSKGKNALVITWTKQKGANGYEIYFTKCNHKSRENTCKKIATVSAGKALKYTKKKLKKQTSYKAFVMAYKIVGGEKVYTDTSLTVHCYTSGGNKKYTNPKKVTVKKSRYKLKAGKTAKIKVKVTKQKKGRNLTNHTAEARFISSNKNVATVSRNGKIKAKKKGTCYVYVYAQNGVYKKIKVTVK